jgi:hypothetical protein
MDYYPPYEMWPHGRPMPRPAGARSCRPRNDQSPKVYFRAQIIIGDRPCHHTLCCITSRYERQLISIRGKLLTLVNMNGQAAGTFPTEYDGMLGLPKPSWGDWETRDVDVVDVRRIPQLASGYCYGSRIMYVDKQYYQTLA